MTYLNPNFGVEYDVPLKNILEFGRDYRNILYDRKLLVFRNLHDLTAQQFYDLHSAFGRPWLEPYYKLSHEVVTKLPKGGCLTEYGNVLMAESMGNRSIGWHRDIPFHRQIRYPIRSLYPIALPTPPGPTVFMDSDVLWDRVSPARARDFLTAQIKIQSWYDVVFDKPIRHRTIPMVERHPYTKRSSILLNAPGERGWVQSVSCGGIDSPTLCKELLDIAATPDNIYTHEWQLGDLVLFDNASGLMHGRPELPSAGKRSFWRINVKHYWQP